MRKFELRLGGHLTSGTVELYNCLLRLHTGIEAAVVPVLAAAAGLLEKFSAGNAGVIPAFRNTGTALSTAAGGSSSCKVQCVQSGTAELTVTEAAKTPVVAVPDASCPAVQLEYPTGGSSAVTVDVGQAEPDTLYTESGAEGTVLVHGDCYDAQLEKWTGVQSAAMAHSDLDGVLEKDSGGEIGITALAEAEPFAGRFRKLYELDAMTVSEMDGMTLEELDYVIIDSV